MDLRIFTEPQQGASYRDLLAVARAARDGGFSAFFRSDHVLAFGSAGLPGPSESFVNLGAIATQVPDIRLGTLVASATFRHPSMLAIAAAHVDDISRGRLELGIGSGWNEVGTSRVRPGLRLLLRRPVRPAHRAAGDHHRAVGDAARWAIRLRGQALSARRRTGLPKPRAARADGALRVPIIIGGHGPRRTPALAARFADEFNVAFSDLLDVVQRQYRAGAARRARRPGATPARSPTRSRMWSASARRGRVRPPGRGYRSRSRGPVTGEPARRHDRRGDRHAAAVVGRRAERAYLQVLNLQDLEHIALIAAEVLPACATTGRRG